MIPQVTVILQMIIVNMFIFSLLSRTRQTIQFVRKKYSEVQRNNIIYYKNNSFLIRNIIKRDIVTIDLRVYLIKTICVVQFYVHSFWLCNGTLSYFVLTVVRLIIIIIMNPNEHLRQTILKKSI